LDPKKIIEWLLLASLSGSGAFIASYVNRMTEAIEDVNMSIRQLNARIEVMTSEIAHVGESLKDHETRLRQLERRQYK